MSRAKEIMDAIWDARNNQGADTEEKLVAAILSIASNYIKSYPLINRVEVIGKNGREYVQYDCSNVQVSEQDDGRTLKVFLS